MRKLIFYNFRPLILAPKIDKQIMFVQSRFLDLLFLIVFCLFVFPKMVDLGTPIRNRMGVKMATDISLFQHKSTWFLVWRSSVSDPLFSRNHNNYCAVGTAWLLKCHFFDRDWPICCFGCVSLCSVLNKSCIEKHPAVEPSVFWGNRRI